MSDDLSLSLRLDHVVVAARTLDDGEAWLRPRLGVGLDPGGRHVGWGTHNRLLQLGGGAYLELIAPDPSQPAPTRPRLFGLDRAMRDRSLTDRPRMIHLVMRCDDLERRLPTLPWRPGQPTRMRRDDLAWTITIPGDTPDGLPTRADGQAGGGVLPTLIDWHGAPTPAARLPHRGVVLQSVRLVAPAALDPVLRLLHRCDRRIEVIRSPHFALGLELMTPQGWVLLD